MNNSNDYKSFADLELLSLLKDNNQLAFEEIYKRYWKNLLFVASKKLNNIQEAEDILNDVFVSLWNRRYTMPEIESLNNYLKVALRYQVLKIWARRDQENKYNTFKESAVFENNNNVQDTLNCKELNNEIKNVVLNLPEKCQTVFKMSREEGMSQKQISFHLGISQKTVEAHINKAIKTLKSSLKHHFLIFFL